MKNTDSHKNKTIQPVPFNIKFDRPYFPHLEKVDFTDVMHEFMINRKKETIQQFRKAIEE